MNRPTLLVSLACLLAGSVTLSAQNPLRFEELPRHVLPEEDHDTGPVELVDLDGDGDLDAVLAGTPMLIYRNDGTGRFTDVTAASLPDNTEGTALLGDVDGDADLDMVVGSVLLRNDGAGVFTSSPLPSGASARGAFGDVDGDGDLDLAVCGSGSQNRLFVNDGTGAFTDVTVARMPVDTDDTAAMAFGDVDGDGDLDLVCGNGFMFMSMLGPQQRDRLYLNDGSGTFSDATVGRLPVDDSFTSRLVFADLDQDGDQDLLVVGATFFFSATFARAQSPFRVCTNDGTGVFTVHAELGGSRLGYPPRNTRQVALGDIDGDGDLDIVDATPSYSRSAMSGSFSYPGKKRVLLNDGAAGFTDVTGGWLPALAAVGESTGGVALGDVDGDGDLDLFCGNGPAAFGYVVWCNWCVPPPPQNRLYLNLGRQLNAPSELRVGQTYTLDAYLRDGQATAGAFALPIVSFAPASLALPPFGTLGIDPSLAVGLPWIPISQTTGVGSLSLSIVNDPGLVGTRVFTQALLVPSSSPASLSNVVVDALGH